MLPSNDTTEREKKTDAPYSTGFGQHGDYLFGWKDDSLQHAMDNKCFGPRCQGLTTQTFPVANECSVKPMVSEQVDGWIDYLPGQAPA